jgi:zinc transporter 1/2/3
MKMKHLKRILLSEEGADGNTPGNLAAKIVSIFVFLGMAMAFGLMPYYIKRFRTSTKFLSISNAFSGGLFLGIGLFHVLPESAEKLTQYELPWAYFCAYISYALILFVEKVAFNSHSLLHGHGNSHKEPRISVEPLPNLNNSGRQSNNEGSEEHLIEKEVEKEEKNEKEENEQEHEHDEHDHSHEHGKKVGITPYILLLALGFHGFFEGMALGIQGEVRDTLFLALAIAAHKWAASLTLGISIIKSGIKLKQLFIMISIFALIGPVGIAFGMILKATANDIVEAIFLAISVGTFLYIACSEVLVEEFEHPENKYIKFCAFMIGGIFTAGLSLIEAFTGVED